MKIQVKLLADRAREGTFEKGRATAWLADIGDHLVAKSNSMLLRLGEVE